MNVKVFGKHLCVNTAGNYDTAGSPPTKKTPARKPGRRKPKK